LSPSACTYTQLDLERKLTDSRDRETAPSLDPSRNSLPRAVTTLAGVSVGGARQIADNHGESSTFVHQYVVASLGSVPWRARAGFGGSEMATTLLLGDPASSIMGILGWPVVVWQGTRDRSDWDRCVTCYRRR
jgi:hypothetical protein